MEDKNLDANQRIELIQQVSPQEEQVAAAE